MISPLGAKRLFLFPWAQYISLSSSGNKACLRQHSVPTNQVVRLPGSQVHCADCANSRRDSWQANGDIVYKCSPLICTQEEKKRGI